MLFYINSNNEENNEFFKKACIALSSNALQKMNNEFLIFDEYKFYNLQTLHLLPHPPTTSIQQSPIGYTEKGVDPGDQCMQALL